MVGDTLLEMKDISKSFGGVKALDSVNLDLRSGEVHALMGENGAGKSTLMKVLSGNYHPDSGEILIDGKTVAIPDASAAKELGIAIIHQELNTVPDLSVADNLSLGAEPTTGAGILNRKQAIEAARIKLATIGADIDPRKRMGDLSVGQQQMVEIARAVSEDARILILDEPTAALSEVESQLLFTLIEEMRDRGIAMVYISHRMGEVWKLSDRITVFRDGKHVATTERENLSPEDIVRQMIGRAVDDLYVRDDHKLGGPKLEVEGLEGNGIGPVTFTVHAGEVVGMVGLVGAGRTEIARLIAGSDRIRRGTIKVDGKTVAIHDPHSAVAARIGMLPESRKEQALLLEQSISDNLVLSSLDKFSFLGVLRPRTLAAAVKKQIRRLRIRSASPSQDVGSLSGGNQQKVVLARWLEVNPDVLILDEPTRGVDIGAKYEIYRIINEVAQSGTAVLVISSDLPEALGISDRILVIHDGTIVHELDWTEATEEKVMLYATGVAS